jgi:hypothetical protein
MNLQQQEQFYQMVTRLKANSRAASASTKDDAIITEMVNGFIVSRPAKKIEYISEPAPKASEPKVWNLNKDGPVLQQESKAASVPGINKLKVICDFIRSNGRHCANSKR